ncbi:hypothetical protein DPMN_177656 [Dreissena polymorpha]|uniref:Uncharacterized protein n=1 Tax=Dreissena polymorpha TaxID=45954 RepID=A0A9D4EAL8_DREPO|nr:hypothetical protein DPMN_177656 [Dreissena polymorpha]
MPTEIANCISRLTPVVNTTDAKKVPGLGTPQDVYLYCLQQFVWRADMVRWEDYDITKKDKDFINGLLVSVGIVVYTLLLLPFNFKIQSFLIPRSSTLQVHCLEQVCKRHDCYPKMSFKCPI